MGHVCMVLAKQRVCACACACTRASQMPHRVVPDPMHHPVWHVGQLACQQCVGFLQVLAQEEHC